MPVTLITPKPPIPTERLLLAWDDQGAAVALEASGAVVEHEQSDDGGYVYDQCGGWEDMFTMRQPPGLWVWEGTAKSVREEDIDGRSWTRNEYEGEFREMTPVEWATLATKGRLWKPVLR